MTLRTLNYGNYGIFLIIMADSIVKVRAIAKVRSGYRQSSEIRHLRLYEILAAPSSPSLVSEGSENAFAITTYSITTFGIGINKEHHHHRRHQRHHHNHHHHSSRRRCRGNVYYSYQVDVDCTQLHSFVECTSSSRRLFRKSCVRPERKIARKEAQKFRLKKKA